MFFGATCEKAATAQKVALTAIMDAVVMRMGITLDNVFKARGVHQKAKIRQRLYEQTRITDYDRGKKE
jgi:N-acetylmuramic acid 6-phosphate (MurNAc-6-P) etherase